MKILLIGFTVFLTAAFAAEEPHAPKSGQAREIDYRTTPKSYPVLENGSSTPLMQRTLQALNVGSTFKRPEDEGTYSSLRSVAGIYTESGKVFMNQLKENTPYCDFQDNRPPRDIPDQRSDRQVLEKYFCVLEEIEGSESFKANTKTMYRTILTLRCGDSELKIYCSNPSNGYAKEMSLAQFEAILSKVLFFGNLALETPFTKMGPNRESAEQPVTPGEIVSGKLSFKLLDAKPLTSKANFDDGKTYKRGYQNGESFDSVVPNRNANVGLSIDAKKGADLASPIAPADVSGFPIEEVTVGYEKKLGSNFPKQSYLTVHGNKTIKGVNTRITVNWDDPVHSHITYEAMWKIPGGDKIPHPHDKTDIPY